MFIHKIKEIKDGRVLTEDSGWKEEQHPRVQSGKNAGQFTKRGTMGVVSGMSKAIKQARVMGGGEPGPATKKLIEGVGSRFVSYIKKKRAERQEKIDADRREQSRVNREAMSAARKLPVGQPISEKPKPANLPKLGERLKHPIGPETEMKKQQLKNMPEGPEKEALRKAEHARRFKKRKLAREAFRQGKPLPQPENLGGQVGANLEGGILTHPRGNGSFETGKVQNLKSFNGGVNIVFKGHLEGDGDGVFKFLKDELKESGPSGCLYRGIIKPMKQEAKLDLEKCPQVHREILTSLIDEVVGLGIVPKTIGRVTTEKGFGSCQQFVENLKLGKAPKAGDREDRFKAYQAAIFDRIIGACDRHGNNYGMADGKIVFIDNGLNFAANPEGAWNGDYYRLMIKREWGHEWGREKLLGSNRFKDEMRRQSTAIKNKRNEIDNWFQQAKLPRNEQEAFWDRVERIGQHDFC